MNKITSFVQKALNHSVARNSLIVLSGNMVTNFFAYLYHLVVGRILGPEKYGELAALLSLFYILNVPAQSVQTILTKYFSGLKARGETGEAKYLFFQSSKWLVVAGIAGLVIIYFFMGQLATFLHIHEPLNFIWLYLIFASFFISIAFASIYQGYQLFLMTNVVGATGTFLKVVFGAIGALIGVSATLISNIFANIIMYFLYFLPLGFIFKSKKKPFAISKKSVLSYSVPAFITTLGLTALYSQDVILVKHFFNAETAGIYSALSVLGKVIFYASSALSFVLFPVVAEMNTLGKRHKKIVFSGLALIGAISFVLTVFYFVFPRLVVDLLFGQAFYAAAPYLGFFGLFITFFSMSSLLMNISLAASKTGVYIFATVGALSQTLLIFLYHQTIFEVVMVNLAVSVGLFFSLLLYYGYAKEVRV